MASWVLFDFTCVQRMELIRDTINADERQQDMDELKKTT
jgi:hypothetical protein